MHIVEELLGQADEWSRLGKMACVAEVRLACSQQRTRVILELLEHRIAHHEQIIPFLDRK